jgi:integrase
LRIFQAGSPAPKFRGAEISFPLSAAGAVHLEIIFLPQRKLDSPKRRNLLDIASSKMEGAFSSAEEKSTQQFRHQLIDAGLISAPWLLRFQQRNGRNRKMTVFKVWEQYQKDHLPAISESARVLKIFRCERFLPPLYGIRMCELNPQVISEFIRFSKDQVAKRAHSQRSNFDKELKDLRSILNWYRDTFDFQFASPINRTHYKLAVIKEIPKQQRQISVEQLQLFLGELSEFYRDLATIQFFCGARIGEIAGLHWKNIDLEQRTLKIQEVLVWIRGRPKVKSCPKNGLSRDVFLNDTMLEILRRYQALRNGTGLVFHRKGSPLLYSAICGNFNRAWKRAGLPQFKSSHQARYAAAQFSRRLTGSIDGAKAVTGHQSLQLAQKYSDYSSIDQNRTSVEMLEIALLEKKPVA